MYIFNVEVALFEHTIIRNSEIPVLFLIRWSQVVRLFEISTDMSRKYAFLFVTFQSLWKLIPDSTGGSDSEKTCLICVHASAPCLLQVGRGQGGEAGPLNHNVPISTRRDLVEPAILNVLYAYMVLEQILVVSFCALICIRDVRQREQVKMAKREKKNDDSEAGKAFTNDLDFWIFYLNLNGNDH